MKWMWGTEWQAGVKNAGLGNSWARSDIPETGKSGRAAWRGRRGAGLGKGQRWLEVVQLSERCPSTSKQDDEGTGYKCLELSPEAC